jgi:hypothetical protein
MIFWRDATTGAVAVWVMNGFQIAQSANLGTVAANWSIAGIGDFNFDGSTDLIWRDTTGGTVAIWLMNGVQVAQIASLGAVPLVWSIVLTGDFNGDGTSDVLWRDSAGSTVIWFMNGLQTPVVAFTQGYYGPDWQIQGANAD